jgi:hypothetical protein
MLGVAMNKHLQTVKDHLWGPTGSVILHLIIVFLLINFLVFKIRTTEPDYLIEIGEMEVIEPRDPNVIDDDIEDVDDMVDMQAPLLDDAPPDPEQSLGNEQQIDEVPLEVHDFKGTLRLKDLIASRSGEERIRMLDKYGYKRGKLTEPAVIKALDWLRQNQIKDGDNKGSWDPGTGGKDKYVALAGLGLLAFLAHGETTASEQYGDTVLWAIEFLQRAQAKSGEFCPLNQHGVYAHAIATYAMGEACAMTRIPPLRDSMNRAVLKIVQGQQDDGDWDYHYNKGARRDTSVASWQIQALKAAYMADCDVPGLAEALDKAAVALNRSFIDNNSIFRYSNANEPHNVTPMAVLCLQMIGHGRDNTTRAALRGMKEEQCSWNVQNQWAMYRWYYLSQAKFHGGGSDWTNWNNMFAPAYVKNQQADGRWVPPVADGGHGDAGYGPAFPTALGALTLQVYYRFLPTYQTQATEKIEVDVDEIDEGIEVDII